MKNFSYCVFLFLVFTRLIFAQDLLSINNDENTISINLYVPIFNDFRTSSEYFQSYYNVSGWMTKLNLQYKVSEKGFLIFELPYASGKIETGISYRQFDVNTQQYSDWISEKYLSKKNSIGNPFVGYKVNFKSGLSSLVFGLSIPLVNDKNIFPASNISSASLLEGISTFENKLATAKIFYDFSPKFNSYFRFTIGLGPEFWFFTEKSSDDKIEVFAIYYIKAGFEKKNLSFFVGLMNMSLLTESKLSISYATTNQLMVIAKYRFGNFLPSIGYRKYLSTVPTNYNYSLHFGLSYSF